MPDSNKNSKTIMTVIVVAIVAVLAYGVLTMPDNRTPTERLGDAIHELPKGADKAVQQLEKRTPGEKLGDKVEELGEDIKRNTNNN